MMKTFFFLSLVVINVSTCCAQWSKISSILVPQPLVVSGFVSIGTSVFAIPDNGQYGVIITTNDGTTWTHADSGISGTKFSRIAADGQSLYIKSKAAKYVSIDTGKSWTVLDPSVPLPPYLKVGRWWFAIEDGSCYRTSDFGGTWGKVQTGLKGAPAAMWLRHGLPSLIAGDTVYTTTNSGAVWSIVAHAPPSVTHICDLRTRLIAATLDHGIYTSVDTGLTWVAANSGLTDTEIVAVCNMDDTILAGTKSALFLSTNAGVGWSLVDTNRIYCESLCKTPHGYLTSNVMGIFASSNGQSWSYRGQSTSDTVSVILLIQGLGNHLFLSCPQGLFFSTDHGSSWTESTNWPLTEYWEAARYRVGPIAVAVDHGDFYAESNDGRMFFSRDTGSTWNRIALPTSDNNIAEINCFAASSHALFLSLSIDNKDSAEVHDTTTIFATTNLGSSWRPADSAIRRYLGYGNGTPGGRMHLLSWSGPYQIVAAPPLLFSTNYVSSDTARSWTAFNPLREPYPIAVQSAIRMGSNILLGTADPNQRDSAAYISTDVGLSWIRLNSGLPSAPNDFVEADSRLLAIVPSDVGGGIYGSPDSGWTWLPITAGYRAKAPDRLAFDGAHVFAQQRNVLWERALQNIPMVLPESKVNGTLPAGQSVYPNPSAGVIRYCADGGTSGDAVLQLRDALGRVVLSKRVAKLSVGRTVELDLRSFVPGAYSLVITTEDTQRQYHIIKR